MGKGGTDAGGARNLASVLFKEANAFDCRCISASEASNSCRISAISCLVVRLAVSNASIRACRALKRSV
ncbi:MAG: hypothetical protein A3D16_17765 [Rhodobacterales bacterium RIFCSPHIGHO2_02_FULL_62_130]|nr:MAG: hypothetical protein A3D16_17765 [Rhodobacterales bacterium RIFCSPHIGHO2_02_FULL_62_130]OHC53398.1 MAG: hypothetical protein A3E48_18890 [Rhodobacterales bacterium RIFCSPHIGHO2_12_FULL_62_75]HCY98445.1 hypothetical protein [Rhodobacter sp.]